MMKYEITEISWGGGGKALALFMYLCKGVA